MAPRLSFDSADSVTITHSEASGTYTRNKGS